MLSNYFHTWWNNNWNRISNDETLWCLILFPQWSLCLSQIYWKIQTHNEIRNKGDQTTFSWKCTCCAVNQPTENDDAIVVKTEYQNYYWTVGRINIIILIISGVIETIVLIWIFQQIGSVPLISFYIFSLSNNLISIK